MGQAARTDLAAACAALSVDTAPRLPGLARTSPRRLEHCRAASSVMREHAARWRMTERDWAVVAELSRNVAAEMLRDEKPLTVEALLALPDAHALEIFDALRDIVRERRRVSSAAHR